MNLIGAVIEAVGTEKFFWGEEVISMTVRLPDGSKVKLEAYGDPYEDGNYIDATEEKTHVCPNGDPDCRNPTAAAGFGLHAFCRVVVPFLDHPVVGLRADR